MKKNGARNTAILIVVLTAVAILGMAVLRILNAPTAHIEPNRELYPIRGIDLSRHNGLVDFDSVRQAGIDFVYLKASEGSNHRDPSFAVNYAGAHGAGLPVGAYHFFRFDRDGREQALNFLATTAGCRFDLPTVLDVEEWGNAAGVPTEMVVSRLEAMITCLESWGHRAMIYTNKTGDARFIRGHFDGYGQLSPVPLWICSFTDPPLRRREWTLWQHSHRSTVPGVKGYVDMNTFNGNRYAWDVWLEQLQRRNMRINGQ